MIYQTITTVSNEEEAKDIIQKLSKRNLFACAHTKQILSTYYWQDKWVTESEVEISFKHDPKTRSALFQALKDIHPYNVPQIISLPLETTPDYEEWVVSVTKENSD